jgi:hypothetical protein
MKQTAVEYLLVELAKTIKSVPAHTWVRVSDIMTKAREMEKEQIMNAYKADLHPSSDEDAKQYYNETYNKD